MPLLSKFSFLFLICLITNSYANSVSRLANDIKDAQTKNGNIWVVLVAGSNGYWNYRHQADVLHAYQLVHKYNKVPKEQIITFLYDDIANDPANPVKGNVINYPGGENLYTDDVVKDYTGDEVTPENFLGVLTRDQKLINQNKKVLNSTKNDHVFIYFADHGARFLLGFPNGVLYATDFKKALDKMKKQNAYNKMSIYIEACESGSMFTDDVLKLNENVYALTAANDQESSYAVYYDEVRQTYLADEFSINWLLDSFASEGKEETLFTQYLHVKAATNESHVCQFGDLEMAKKFYISEFQGEMSEDRLNKAKRLSLIYELPNDRIRSDEVEFYLTKKHSELKNDDSFRLLLKGRRILKNFMDSLKIKFANKLDVETAELTEKMETKDLNCYSSLINHMQKNCIPVHVHTYLFRYFYLFVNTCSLIDVKKNVQVSDFTQIISKECDLFKEDFYNLPKVV